MTEFNYTTRKIIHLAMLVRLSVYLSRLYVEQYRMIQELCGGTGVVGITDDVGVTDVTDDIGATDI